MQTLIKDGANIEEKNAVSDGAGGNVAAVCVGVVTFGHSDLFREDLRVLPAHAADKLGMVFEHGPGV